MKFAGGQRSETAGVPSVSSENVPDGHINGLQLFAANLAGTADSNSFSLDVYWRMLLKHRKLIGSVTAAFLLLTLIGTLFVTPVYRATAVIQIERHSMRLTQQDGVQTSEEGGMADLEFYQTQYDLLQSRSLAEQVTVRMGLLENPQFVPTPGAGTLKSIFGLLSRSSAYEDSALKRRRTAVQKFTSNLIVEPKRGSRLVQIHYFDPDPRMAQYVVNGVADIFTNENLERRFEASSYARSYLDERLQELKEKVEASEAEAVAYVERAQIVSPGEKHMSLAGLNLSTTNQSMANAKAERTRLEQLWAMAQTDNAYGLPQILDSKAMQSNRENKAVLAAEYQQKLTLFKPNYPEMVARKSQMDELDRQAEKIVNVVRDSIHTQYISAKNQEAELERQLEERKAALIDEQKRSIKYDMLQREVATSRALYEQMLQRSKEMSVVGALGSNNISVVDPAEMPMSPYSPRPILNLVIAGFSGLLFGIAAALTLEHLDNTIKSPEDVEANFKMPVLGLLPLLDDEASVEEALKDQRSDLSEALRSLKTALQFATLSGLPKSLAITSAGPGEGKSTISLALARTCARHGIRVLLIDADLRRPALHRKASLSGSVGLSNFLAATVQASDVVQRMDLDHLFFMSSGPLPPNPADLFSGPKFSSLLAMADEFFDLIIIDAPPVLGLADAPLIANAASETVFVISAGYNKRQYIEVALKRLRMARAHVLGVVLNRFRVEQAGYGYGGGYGRHSYYGCDQPSMESDASVEAPAEARATVER